MAAFQARPADVTMAGKSQIITPPPLLCFAIGSQHLGRRVPTVPAKTRLESSIQMFNPRAIYDCVCRPARARATPAKRAGK